MKIKTDLTAKKAQERNKKYLYKSVHVEQKYRLGDFVFFDVTAAYSLKADQLAQETLKKTEPENNGSFKMTPTQSHTNTLEVVKLKNIVSMDRASLARIIDEVDQIEPKAENSLVEQAVSS